MKPFTALHILISNYVERTSALSLKRGRPSVRHRPAPTTARLHPGGLQQRPRSFSLLSESAEFQFSCEITQNFKQDLSRRKTGIRRTRRGGKVIGDAAGGALSSAPDGGERRDIRTLRTNSADSPGRESDRGRCWSPLGWRRAVVGAVRWRTEGRPPLIRTVYTHTHTWRGSKEDVRTSLRSPPSGSDDGAPPPERTPAVTPTTFPPWRVRQIPVFRRDRSCVKFWVEVATQTFKSILPGRESGWGCPWSPFGWRCAVVGAVPWRTEGRPHFKPSADNVHHEGQPMPGDDQDDIVMTSTDSNIRNTTCPVSGKHVTDLENPVRSIDCKHIYQQKEIMHYLRAKGGRGPCPIAGCPRMLQADKFVPDPLLPLEIQELRDTMKHQTFDTNAIEDFTLLDED
ncbi:hypothetical protein ACLB2K_028908 [Fragaria x ananassa]